MPDGRLAELVGRLESSAGPGRVRADVEELARGPRGRHHPEAMERARRHVREQLEAARWQVRAEPFERRWVLGVDDAGGSIPVWRRLRLHRHLTGVNLLATPPVPVSGSDPLKGSEPVTGSSRRGLLLVAHLDSVACSPGADDNASGVAALLECARLLATLDQPPAVTLAFVDLEEAGRVGSTVLARDRAFRQSLSGVICLESVGTFDPRPGSQRLGGLGLAFPAVARRVRASGNRGDFALALCRRPLLALAERLAEAAAALATPLPVLPARDPRPMGPAGLLATAVFPPLSNLDRSDHAPFWHRGVPAMMLTTTAPFRNPRYHQKDDHPAHVDHARVAALAVALAATVGSQAQFRSRRNS